MDVAPSSNQPDVIQNSIYGAPTNAPMSGNFPAIGSCLGPYFSVGRLGFGTFCSIHKCINLHYNHRKVTNKILKGRNEPKTGLRLVAAKVEIGEFKNSGVLGGEASILHFLDEVLPPQTVPIYMGHYTNRESTTRNVTSAIVMEYLTGQDMHKIREWSTRFQHKLQQQNQEEQRQQILQQGEGRPQFSPPQYSNDCNSNSNENNLTGSGNDCNFSASRSRRRIAINDAVFLTAHVMLPLLRKMHSVGIIHRDVKPSNVVKRTDCSSNLFCIVDFGLSKSIVVPHDSEFADTKQVWKGSNWMGLSPPGSNINHFKLLSPSNSETNCKPNQTRPNNGGTIPKACYRRERSKADFRGTSMYASARVHQLQEYSPRDDIWSLLYVFCDLASGGLPWMLHAANRDREACKILKQRIHGMEAQADGELLVDTRRLLMGDKYHRALFKKWNGSVDPPLEHEQNGLIDDGDDPNLPQPLALSEDEHKVGLLSKAFDHLKGLGYDDIPDYDLIQRLLEGFLEEENVVASVNDQTESDETNIPLIDWKLFSESCKRKEQERRISKSQRSRQGNTSVPIWQFIDEINDPLTSFTFAEAEASLTSGSNVEEENGAILHGEAADLARLPLELRFRIAQMEYNTLHNTTIELHLAMCDWLKVCLPLLYSPWNSSKYEKGGHRSMNDGYRREFFLNLLNKCLDCAAKFGGFRSTSIIYSDFADRTGGIGSDEANGIGEKERPNKRRRHVCIKNMHEPKRKGKISSNRGFTDLITISKVMFELRVRKQAEEKLSRAPPPRLSFGS